MYRPRRDQNLGVHWALSEDKTEKESLKKKEKEKKEKHEMSADYVR